MRERPIWQAMALVEVLERRADENPDPFPQAFFRNEAFLVHEQVGQSMHFRPVAEEYLPIAQALEAIREWPRRLLEESIALILRQVPAFRGPLSAIFEAGRRKKGGDALPLPGQLAGQV